MSDSELPRHLKEPLSRLKSATDSADRIAALKTLAEHIKDDHPDSERAATLVFLAIRSGSVPPSFEAELTTSGEHASRSARILVRGLRALLGAEDAREELAAALLKGPLETLSTILLDRLLTSLDWQRDEQLHKHLKTRLRRLQQRQVARSALSNLQLIEDYVQTHKKLSATQLRKLEDYRRQLALDAAATKGMLAPLGCPAFEALTRSEAEGLLAHLELRLRRERSDLVTPKQLSYIRRMVKLLSLGDDALVIIANEASQQDDITRLSKDQASEVIAWLVEKTGGQQPRGR